MPTDQDKTNLVVRLTAAVDRFFPRAEISELRRMTGGASQHTWCFTATSAQNQARLIMRHAPNPNRHAENVAGFDIEVAVIRAAAREGVPAPRILHQLDPQDGLGEGFICDFIAGETIGRRLQRDARYASVRPLLAGEFAGILARIQQVRPQGVSLRTEAVQAALHAMRRHLDGDPAPRPIFEYGLKWLARHAPGEVDGASLVHGDFRLGNMIITETGIAAVLDWEQVHFGDPIEDLAWLMAPPWRFGAHDKPVAGLTTLAEFLPLYEAAIGRKLELARLRWWIVMSSLRWGNACSRMARRFESGADPTVERAMIARRASESEFDILLGIAEAKSDA